MRIDALQCRWLMVCAALWLVGGLAPVVRAGNNTTGDYAVTVAGSFKGAGTATVRDNRLNVTITVTDESGNKGDLVITDLVVDNNNRFSGDGNILGMSMTIQGRLDPPDSGNNGNGLKTARLMATFVVDSGDDHGRLAGYLLPPPSTVARAGNGGQANPGKAAHPAEQGKEPEPVHPAVRHPPADH